LEDANYLLARLSSNSAKQCEYPQRSLPRCGAELFTMAVPTHTSDNSFAIGLLQDIKSLLLLADSFLSLAAPVGPTRVHACLQNHFLCSTKVSSMPSHLSLRHLQGTPSARAQTYG